MLSPLFVLVYKSMHQVYALHIFVKHAYQVVIELRVTTKQYWVCRFHDELSYFPLYLPVHKRIISYVAYIYHIGVRFKLLIKPIISRYTGNKHNRLFIFHSTQYLAMNFFCPAQMVIREKEK